MIVPYYNCLLIGHRYNQLELDEEGEEMIKDYLEEYLTIHNNCKISIAQLGPKNTQLISRMKNLLHMLITNLSVSVYEINNSYTLSEQNIARYEAMKQVTVKDPQNSKLPAILQNINLLKKYYATYSSESEMKNYLKSLLIQEINHQKRCIIYRPAAQIKSILNQQISKMEGQIFISSFQPEKNQKNQFIVILVNQKGKQKYKLQLLIRQVSSKFKINQQMNVKITSLYTLQYLRKNAIIQLQKILTSYYKIKVANNTQHIMQLKDNMMLIANFRVIIKQGFRLAEEQIKLQQQFLNFVSEMKVKYTNQINKYFKSVSQHQKFLKNKRLYLINLEKKGLICKYMQGFSNFLAFKKKKYSKMNRQCIMIQKRVRGFLLNRQLYASLMNTYLSQKKNLNNKYNQFYRKIIDLQNQNQLQKLSKFNMYKYGFSCCTFILDIRNETNCEQFQPSSILRLLEKVARSKELCTKIICKQNYIQIYTIQGKVFSLGDMSQCKKVQTIPKLVFSIYDMNKENIQSNTNSFQSIIHQFQSSKKNLSFSRQTNNSRISSICDSLKFSIAKTQKKQISQIRQKFKTITGKNYEFKLQQNGNLYGKGSNKHGQLGLQSDQIHQFTTILPFEKVKLVATNYDFTIVLTKTNKLYHFGKQRNRLQQTKIPIQFSLREKISIKQIIISLNDIYFLTNNNKVYSFQNQKTIRIPKDIQLQFDNFHLIRTGGINLEISYLVGFWTNSLDPKKKQTLQKYFTGTYCKSKNESCESLLVDQEKQDTKRINELSAIIQQSSIF